MKMHWYRRFLKERRNQAGSLRTCLRRRILAHVLCDLCHCDCVLPTVASRHMRPSAYTSSPHRFCYLFRSMPIPPSFPTAPADPDCPAAFLPCQVHSQNYTALVLRSDSLPSSCNRYCSTFHIRYLHVPIFRHYMRYITHTSAGISALSTFRPVLDPPSLSNIRSFSHANHVLNYP